MDLTTSAEGNSSRGADLLAAVLVLGGLAGAIIMGLCSEGVYHDDDITHYLFARDGWTDIHALLHRWARPGYNLPAAAVIHWFGFAGCRIFSALQTAVVAWCAYLIARRLMGPCLFAALAAGFVWLEPMTTRLALTTLTETPAAMYLTVGLWLYLRGNRLWSCGVISLVFITRDETLAMLPLMAGAVIYDAWRAAGGIGRLLRTPWLWGCAIALIWAPAAYCLAAWVVDLPAGSSPLYVLSRSYTAEYGSGSLLWFMTIWPEMASVGILALAVGGMVAMGRKGWLLAAWVWGLVGLHTLIFWRGMFASGGYSRFLVPIAGLLAVQAAAGLKAVLAGKSKKVLIAVSIAAAVWLILPAVEFGRNIVTQMNIALPVFWGLLAVSAGVLAVLLWRVALLKSPVALSRAAWAVAAVVLGLTVFQASMEIRPLRLGNSQVDQAIVAAHQRITDDFPADCPMLCTNVLMVHLRPGAEIVTSGPEAIRRWKQACPGSLFVWESKYAGSWSIPGSEKSVPRLLEEYGECLFVEISGPESAAVYRRSAK